jgi:4-hydroxybenzoate polyprenyltransferase
MGASVRGILYGWPGAPLMRRLDRYAQLMRMNRPVGIGLLLWPTLWALFVAARGLPGDARWPALHLLWIFFAGTVVMRSAGCVINDFADRDIDPHVKRTKGRPLAQRLVSPHEALVLFAALVLLALWLVTRLDWKTVQLSFIGAGLTVTYPFMKRFFPLPQFYLGAAFGWAVPMAFVATLGGVPQLGWLLFVITVLWAGIYDTQYAMVDRDDDLKLGVESTAITFGDMDRVIIGAMQVMMLAGLVLTGRMLLLQGAFWIAIAGAAGLFIWQQWLMRARDRDACLKAFKNNNAVGLILLAGFIAG